MDAIWPFITISCITFSVYLIIDENSQGKPWKLMGIALLVLTFSFLGRSGADEIVKFALREHRATSALLQVRQFFHLSSTIAGAFAGALMGAAASFRAIQLHGARKLDLLKLERNLDECLAKADELRRVLGDSDSEMSKEIFLRTARRHMELRCECLDLRDELQEKFRALNGYDLPRGFRVGEASI